MLVHTVEGDDQRSPLVSVSVPALSLALGPNHPNPFNPQTTIPYFVPAGTSPVRVRLVIYDTSGRSVRTLVDETQSGGARDVVWRGDDETGATVSSGIYFCVLQVGNERRTQKLVMLK
jgi:flagellar hook assembly protein FlgD